MTPAKKAPESLARVLFKDPEHGMGALGIEVLGSIALFDQNAPLAPPETIAAAHAMISLESAETAKHIGLASRTINEYVIPRVYDYLGMYQRTRHGLLLGALTSDPPLMHIEQRIPPERDIIFTGRQDITSLLVQGLSWAQIGEILGITEGTIDTQLREMASQSGLHGNAGITAFSILGNNPHIQKLIDTIPRRKTTPLPEHRYSGHKAFGMLESPKKEPPTHSAQVNVIFDGADAIGVEVLWSNGETLSRGLALFEPNTSLGPHEKFVATHMMANYENGEIAKRLGISEYTVANTIIPRLFDHMDINPRNRHGLMLGALTTEPPVMRIEQYSSPKNGLEPSKRELPIVELLLRSFSHVQIAKELGRSESTIRSHTGRISTRYGLHGSAQITTAAALSSNPLLRKIVDTTPKRNVVPLAEYRPR